MFWLIFTGLLLVLSLVGFGMQYLYEKRNPGTKDDGWICLAGGCLVFAAVFLLVCVGTTLYEYSAQVEQNEELAMISSQQQVYKDKAEALTEQFARYLADIYPQHERDVFRSLKPDGLNVYLAKYPDLKASETIVKLVQEIGALQNDFYKQQLLRAETLKNMRYRAKSPWIVQFVMPKIAVPAS